MDGDRKRADGVLGILLGHIETRDGAVRTHLGPAESPDATVTGPVRPVLGVLIGLIELTDAHALGVSYDGDPKPSTGFAD